MKNYSIIFLMLLLCSSIMMTAQPSQKLTNLSITSSNSNSDPSKLINEQSALPNSPSTPASTPSDGWSYWDWDNAELNLGGNYTVTDIYLFDAYGAPVFGVDYLDANGIWQVIDDVTLGAYLQWISVPMNGNVSTSKLRFRKMDSSTSVFEVAVYGYSGVGCPPASTPCDDGDANTENDVEDGNCNCSGTPIVSGGCLADKNAGGNAANIAALDAAYNNPSPYSFRHMMGINDAGQFQGIEDDEVNPISYLTPNMRAFHAMDYDFNFNLQYGTPYEQIVKPKDTDGFPPNIDDVRNYTNFTGIQGMTNISTATEILNKGDDLTWKEKIWEESDWYNLTGGMTIPDGIRQSFQNYTEAFIDVHAPSVGNQLVGSYEVGNELWDYPYAEDYHAMLEGAYNAFVDEYGTSSANWKMKLLPGSFNAASIANTCATGDRNFSNCSTQSGSKAYYQMGDYLDVDNCDILSSFYAINTHAYPYEEGQIYVHPEKADNEFLSFKGAVAFRDANPVFAGKGVWLTETGYDSYNAPNSCNGAPAAGVGELSQAAMNLRIFMMTSRYHLERINFYMGFDVNRTTNVYHGCTYSSSGFWKLGTHPQYGYGSARPAHGATPKPVFFTFSSFLDKFNDKVFTEAVAENDDVYAYILANQDGSDPYLVFWSPTATNDGNALNSLNVNEFINLPSGYKVASTAATPFSTTGNSTTAPFAPNTAPSFTAVNGTNVGSTTITKVKRMPSYIKLTLDDCPVAGTPCDDGDANTTNDVEDGNCNCSGTPIIGNPCQSIVINTGSGSVTISNVASTLELKIIGAGTGWDDQIICDGDCNSTETVSLPFGDYTLKAVNSNPGCYAQYDLTVGGNGTPCGNQGGDSDNDDVCANVDCDDNNPLVGAPQTPGTACDDGFSNTINDVIQSDGCTCEGVPDGNACEVIQITPGSNSVTISNLASSLNLRIIGPGTGWSDFTICDGNCNSTETVPNLSAGNYMVKALGNPYCYEDYDISISNNKLAQLDDDQRLLIFPNPIENNRPTLLLDSPEDEELDIQIYNINSQLIHTQSASTVSGVNEITLDLENAQLASGVYFVKVISAKYTYGATRFVKP